MNSRSELFIGGDWVAPQGTETINAYSAATEEQIGSFPEASPADIDSAVHAARAALTSPEWAEISQAERSALMHRFADVLDSHKTDRARTVSMQNGMPISVANFAEGDGVVALLRYYADLAKTVELEEVRPRLDGTGTTVVQRTPVGVVGAIAPWNFPAVLSMFKLAPVLASGSTVVFKPSPETTLDSFMLAEAAQEAGIPAGVINVVPGGAETGKYLVAHPGVDKVAFTGSTRAGRQIGKVCGELLRPVTLELGGKSAGIILEDASVEETVAGLATASLLNTGQTCYMSTRILAPKSRYAEFVEAITAMASSLPVGDPLDPNTFVGPVVSKTQQERVLGYIEMGKAEGATLTTGGGKPKGIDKGWYVEPTVFSDVDNNSVIAREEIFGPVLSVIPYSDEDEAVALANDSEYGLGGTVWTADKDRGLGVARRVVSGSFGVNRYDLDWGAPFGGVKSSGLGRELGPEGLEAYFSLKSIFLGD
ncbi:aldehyde dehydrogenase [Brevibacterium yomogidense]|uniref:Aldehyde dehydrogenase n=1 Tax=Brevibacterium yomogidense TaxID=946573 RepID=A0A1X6XJ35_9MICO|nr:aldehyde dehydrogenase [Brevibacterium yomogidense]SLM99153.1 Aldehyde dehydrogenase [Brevibacterium yomogidense]